MSAEFLRRGENLTCLFFIDADRMIIRWYASVDAQSMSHLSLVVLSCTVPIPVRALYIPVATPVSLTLATKNHRTAPLVSISQ
jgi:hypothetical protein